MPHDVFISYSSKDKAIADAACAAMESHGIRCWIAPRDILPGEDWGEAIVNAIIASRVLVLVFSAHANESPQVKREVQDAFEREKTVVPLRVENVMPARTLSFYLRSVHWLDAIPLGDQHLQKLAETVRRSLATSSGPGASAGGGAAVPGDTTEGSSRSTAESKGPGVILAAGPGATRVARHARATRLALVIGLLLALAVAILAVTRWRPIHSTAGADPTPGPATSQVAPVTSATRPGDLSTSPSTAPSKPSPSQLAVSELLRDLELLDARIGALNAHFAQTASTPAEVRLAYQKWYAGESGYRPVSAIFTSFRNVKGADEVYIGLGLTYPVSLVEDRIGAFSALGAKPEAVRAFADNLFFTLATEKNLYEWYRDLDAFTQRLETAMKLGLRTGPDPAEQPFFIRMVSVPAEELRSRYALAHVSGLRVLIAIRPNLPTDAPQRLASLVWAEPRQLIDDARAATLEAELAAKVQRLDVEEKDLRKEKARLWERAVEEYSARLRPPFKLTDRSPDELAALLPDYDKNAIQIRATDSPIAAISRIRRARFQSQNFAPLAALTCCFRYASLFSPRDPAAEEYARAAAQLVLQDARLDYPPGLYLYHLADGPAKEGGLRVGDVVLDYNGTPVPDQAELDAALKQTPAAEPVRVEYLRRDGNGLYQRQTTTLPRGGALGAAFLPI